MLEGVLAQAEPREYLYTELNKDKMRREVSFADLRLCTSDVYFKIHFRPNQNRIGVRFQDQSYHVSPTEPHLMWDVPTIWHAQICRSPKIFCFPSALVWFPWGFLASHQHASTPQRQTMSVSAHLSTSDRLFDR